MRSKSWHLGVCTSGGDCPGLNAVIRAIVKHAVGRYGLRVTGIRNGLSGLMDSKLATVPLNVADVHDLCSVGGTILGTSNRGSPFRKKEESARALKLAKSGWKKIGLDGLIVVGGDGSHLIARHLYEHGLPMIGIPKTIDNDVWGSDRSIGFSSAVDVAVDAAQRLKSSADAHNRIMVLEVMGRHAGHIALESGISAGANAILIPEIPFDYDILATHIRKRTKLGRSSYVIVAAEGAYPLGGKPLWKQAPSGAHLLGGIGEHVGRELNQRTGIDTRVTVLGHIQRGGSPNPTDRLLSAKFGTKAVDLAWAQGWGVMLGISKGEITQIPYSQIQDLRQLVDAHGETVGIAEALGTTLGRRAPYKGLI
jgi:6-phosphofructokinase 1